MCGRYTLHALPVDVSARFSLAKTWFTITPRYNIAPSQPVAAVIQTDDGRVLADFRWGLIPFWAKDGSTSHAVINARAETIATKAAFRQAFRQHRCLLPADGFYEWAQTGGKRQPVYIRLKSKELFAFAGIWEAAASTNQNPLGTCAIITVEPNDFIKPIHNRMPAILAPAHESTWLDPAASIDTLESMLRSYPSQELESYFVSSWVNSPKVDDPKCFEPLVAEDNTPLLF
jgi:putative SOS response-associated peptidase YedK